MITLNKILKTTNFKWNNKKQNLKRLRMLKRKLKLKIKKKKNFRSKWKKQLHWLMLKRKLNWRKKLNNLLLNQL
jgi:hypothetical protein